MMVEKTLKEAYTFASKIEADDVVDRVLHHFETHTRAVNLDNLDWIEDISTGKGAYYWRIKFPQSDKPWPEQIKTFGENWQCWKAKKPGNTPKYQTQKSARVANSTNQGDWVPFYLGIRDNIRSRIREHINGPTNLGTGALRLGDRKMELAEFSIQLSHITFDISKNE